MVRAGPSGAALLRVIVGINLAPYQSLARFFASGSGLDAGVLGFIRVLPPMLGEELQFPVPIKAHTEQGQRKQQDEASACAECQPGRCIGEELAESIPATGAKEENAQSANFKRNGIKALAYAVD